MEEYFPDQFRSPLTIRGWVNYKDMLLKKIEALLDPSDETEKNLDDANNRLVQMVKPGDLADKELKYDKDFEKNCIMLAQFTNESVKKISVREYFALLEHYNEINKHGRAKNKV